jgi:hypothetical protein
MHNYCRLFAIVSTIVTAASILGFAQAKSGADAQLIQAEKDRFAAMIKPDASALERLLANELTYTHSNASLQSKAEFIGDLKSGTIDYVSVVPNEPEWKVRVLGNTAIVTGVAAVNVIDRGTDLKIRIRYINVHVNRDGRWQMIAWQSTRFPQ